MWKIAFLLATIIAFSCGFTGIGGGGPWWIIPEVLGLFAMILIFPKALDERS